MHGLREIVDCRKSDRPATVCILRDKAFRGGQETGFWMADSVLRHRFLGELDTALVAPSTETARNQAKHKTSSH